MLAHDDQDDHDDLARDDHDDDWFEYEEGVHTGREGEPRLGKFTIGG